MRLSHLVRLALAAWVLRWAAAELAVRLARPADVPADGPLPGRMPEPPVRVMQPRGPAGR